MKKMLLKISVVCSILSACMLFVCELVRKTLPVLARMLFRSFGGSFSEAWYQVDLRTAMLLCGMAFLVSVVASVWLGVRISKQERE